MYSIGYTQKIFLLKVWEDELIVSVHPGIFCPEAIFCSNDFFAYGAEIELLKQGYSVPDDVALLGVGESQLGKSAPVPISSFVSPSGKITEGILDICKMWSNGKKDLVKTCIEPVLFERRSTLK